MIKNKYSGNASYCQATQPSDSLATEKNFLIFLISSNELTEKDQILISYLIKDVLINNKEDISNLINEIYRSDNRKLLLDIIFNNQTSIANSILGDCLNDFFKILSTHQYKDFFIKNISLNSKTNIGYLNYCCVEDNSDRNNKNLVIEAVKQNGLALEYASNALKNDKEIVTIAVKQNGLALEYASNALKNDKEIVTIAVKQNGWMLDYASDALKEDQEIVSLAVKQTGTALYGASKILKDNQKIVNMAVKEDGAALEYASHALQNDKMIVLAAVKNNKWALTCASRELKNSKEIVLAAVKKDGGALKYAGDVTKKDEEIVLAAVKQDGLLLQYVDAELKANMVVVITAIEQNGRALQYASNNLKNNKTIVDMAVKENGSALQYASNNLKNDREIVCVAVKKYGSALEYASDILKSNEEIVGMAVKQNGWALRYADDALKANNNIVLAAVKQNGEAIQYASSALKDDKDILLAVIKNIGWVGLRENNSILANIKNRANEDIIFTKEVLERVPSLIHNLFIKEGSLNEIRHLMDGIFSNQKKSLNLIWFGSLPMSYYENLEKIVRYNPEYKITLWINDAKASHTIAVINQSAISEEIFRKITIRSFDREIFFMLNNLTDVSEVNKNTILQAYDLYEKYVSGTYHNYAGACDIARLIILALMPSAYMDIDCTFESAENWNRFKNSLSEFPDKGTIYIKGMNPFIYAKRSFEDFIMASLELIIHNNLNSKQFNECRYAQKSGKRCQLTVKLTGPHIFKSNKRHSLGHFKSHSSIYGLFPDSTKAEDPKDSRWREVPLKGEVLSVEFEDLPERSLLSL